LPGYIAPVTQRHFPQFKRAWWLIVLVVNAAAFSTFAGNAQEGPQGPTTPVPLGPRMPLELEEYAADWPTTQGNLAATRAALNSPINAESVDRLEIDWTFELDSMSGWGGMTSSPIVAGNTVYIQDRASNVFALSRNTGRLKWRHDYDIESGGPNGLALGYGRIFGALADTAEVFALNARNGNEIWHVQLSANTGEDIDVAPVVYDNTVYVSTAPAISGNYYGGGQKGVFFALDAGTGSVLWQFDTTNNLWGNPRLNSGGGLWYPPSIDADGNFYFGTGNAGPWPGTSAYPNGSSRPGDNDYASSMVSLDATTGAVRWHVNASPHNLFDLDFQNTPVLVDLITDVDIVKLAIDTGKTGEIIAVDANSGEIVWRTTVGTHENDDLTELPAGESVEVLPGTFGGIETAVSYADGTLFVPVVNLSTQYTSTGIVRGSVDLATATGELVALEVRDGSVKWKIDMPQGPFGGTAVANDVVFVSTLDGVFVGYDAVTGERLWHYQASSGFNAPPAIAGDMVIVAAAGPRIPNAQEAAAAATPGASAEPVMEVIAFRLEQPEPTATPEVNNGP
jgi:glucose dehydrogenase